MKDDCVFEASECANCLQLWSVMRKVGYDSAALPVISDENQRIKGFFSPHPSLSRTACVSLLCLKCPWFTSGLSTPPLKMQRTRQRLFNINLSTLLWQDGVISCHRRQAVGLLLHKYCRWPLTSLRMKDKAQIFSYRHRHLCRAVHRCLEQLYGFFPAALPSMLELISSKKTDSETISVFWRQLYLLFIHLHNRFA